MEKKKIISAVSLCYVRVTVNKRPVWMWEARCVCFLCPFPAHKPRPGIICRIASFHKQKLFKVVVIFLQRGAFLLLSSLNCPQSAVWNGRIQIKGQKRDFEVSSNTAFKLARLSKNSTSASAQVSFIPLVIFIKEHKWNWLTATLPVFWWSPPPFLLYFLYTAVLSGMYLIPNPAWCHSNLLKDNMVGRLRRYLRVWCMFSRP